MNEIPLRELLNESTQRLTDSGVPNARKNAEWLISFALNCSPLDLYTQGVAPIIARDAENVRALITRRRSREPLQYILGTTEFMSLPFDVRPGVFVPRPDTEVLVEDAERFIRALPLDRAAIIADVCCGSGVIGLSLAERIPNIEVIAVDDSDDACELTRHNAERLGVSDRVRVFSQTAADFLCEPESAKRDTPNPARKFSAIVCNPPYIESGLIRSLPPEVRDHEPVAALDGGVDGLDFYRDVIPMMGPRIADHGGLWFEIGDTQGPAVETLLHKAGFEHVETVQDLTGRDRVVKGIMMEGNRG